MNVNTFDTSDHNTLACMPQHSVGWFVNYLTDRTQATQVEGLTCPAGFSFRTTFITYVIMLQCINSGFEYQLCGREYASFYLYAENTVNYWCASTLRKTFEY